jgi:toxin ParE1/3/4
LGGETPCASNGPAEETCQVSQRQILLRPAAERELEQQAQYIAGSSGVEAARPFYRAAEETCRLIAGRPGIGRPVPYRNPLLAETRMFRMKGFTSHLIFYRPTRNGVEIVCVIHGARDIEGLFEP